MMHALMQTDLWTCVMSLTLIEFLAKEMIVLDWWLKQLNFLS